MDDTILGDDMSIRAIYKDGVFKPLEDVTVKEGTEVDVYPRGEQAGDGEKPKRPWKSVKDSSAYGIWKDRDDIGDGVEYVNRIRKYRRK
jgi:predicted DNA-binding antitoxin AbrB/MazE fold protein